MMNGLSKLFSGVILLSTIIFAQHVSDGRSVGMGFSNSADTRGLQHLGLNPATLALETPYNFELNILSVQASVVNNSFNRSLYDRYFTTGDSLTSSDKSSILGAVPSDGLNSLFGANANILAFYVPNFSLSLSGTGSGGVTLPREVLDIALNGNDDLGRIYDLSSLDGVAWGGLTVAASGAYKFDTPQLQFFDYIAVGLTGKYIAGVGYAETTAANGSLQNVTLETPALLLDGMMEAQTARGGSGMAFDLGAIGQVQEQLTVSLSIVNLLGSINWNQDAENHYFSFESDSMALSTDGIEDSFSESDSSASINSFSTRLPLALDLGAAYSVNDKLVVTAEYEQVAGNNMGHPGGARLGLGTELRYIPFLPLRTGFSIGGKYGSAFAFGFGLDLKFWYLDFGMLNHGGVAPGSSRGVTMAATTRFRL